MISAIWVQRSNQLATKPHLEELFILSGFLHATLKFTTIIDTSFYRGMNDDDINDRCLISLDVFSPTCRTPCHTTLSSVF